MHMCIGMALFSPLPPTPAESHWIWNSLHSLGFAALLLPQPLKGWNYRCGSQYQVMGDAEKTLLSQY